MPNFRVAVIEQMPILCPVHAVGTRLRDHSAILIGAVKAPLYVTPTT